jgi:DNA repair protein RecN (Recombination protein N)
MLIEMRIENFILIEALNLTFSKGLNIFSGETGAGKSMIIGAINAGLGGKVSADLIRKGAPKALVQLIFSVEEQEVVEALTAIGIDMDGDLLIVTREILPSNRSVVRLNDRVITLPTLRALSDLLIDIHGQHEHQTLLYPKNHLKYLDLMGDLKHQRLIETVKDEYTIIKGLQKEIEELSVVENVDVNYLNFQLQEIDALKLTEDDERHLEDKFKYYKNIETIFSNTQSVLQILSGDQENGVKEMLTKAISLITEVSTFDEKLQTYLTQFNDTLYQLDDLQSEVRHYIEGLDVDEKEMFEVEERMNAINELKIKYGKTVEDILIKRTDLEDKLSIATKREHILAELHLNILTSKKNYIKKSKVLQASRHKLKLDFELNVLKELKLLNMIDCQFDATFVEKKLPDGEYRLSPNGFDDVEFMISTNPGMSLKPLAKIASGGEISRIMLAIKIALSHHDVIKTLVFDEVDTGISGQTAIVVGEKIQEITRDYQVLCITHLPQIAVMADCHFYINKSVNQGLGVTDVKSLDDHEKLSEIARMLSGTNSDTAKQNAKEMLTQAKTYKSIS